MVITHHSMTVIIFGIRKWANINSYTGLNINININSYKYKFLHCTAVPPMFAPANGAPTTTTLDWTEDSVWMSWYTWELAECESVCGQLSSLPCSYDVGLDISLPTASRPCLTCASTSWIASVPTHIYVRCSVGIYIVPVMLCQY